MKLRSYLLAAAAALALVGCGGGSGGGTATVPLSGTAAVGTPLARATVELRDAVGTDVDLRTTADASGRFTFPNVSGLTPPFMLRATGTVAGRPHILYSFSQTLPTSGVLNATPLTNAVVQAALPSGQTLDGAFRANSLLTGDAVVDQAKLATAITNLQIALSAVFAALDVPANTDPFTTAFSANHIGLDRLLDLIEFHAEAGGLRVAEKGNPQGAITVPVAAGPTAPTELPELTVPAGATANLTLLPSFVAGVNAWLGDANRTRADFDALVHANFIDYGENRDQAFTFFTTQLLRTGTSVRIASYSVDGCKALPGTNPSQIVCDLSFGLEYTSTTTAAVRQDNAEIPVIFVQGAAQPWQLYGNQMPFSADFWPVVDYLNGNVLVGFNFNVPVNQPGNRTAVGARIEFLDVSSGSGVPLGHFNLVKSGFPECEYLATSVNDCNNAFLQSHQSNRVDIAAINRLQSAGHLKARMIVNYSGIVSSAMYEFLVDQPFFTLETGRAAATAAISAFNIRGLGTPSINFSGGNIEFLSIWYGSSAHVATDWSDVQALNGSFTAPASENIMGISAVARDARDRKIWFSRSAPPPTTQPPTTQPPVAQPPVTDPVTPPTTPPVYGTRLDWTPPAAPPTNAVDNITQRGNLAFRFFDNLGNTQTWQASSGATDPTSGELAFAPAAAVGNQSLRVVYSNLDVAADRWTTRFFRGTEPSNGTVDGMGNALVWCDDSVGTASVFERTRVLLSHNVQLSDLTALQSAITANQSAGFFDAIDCGHASLMTEGGHRETLTFNGNGTATHHGSAVDPLVLDAGQLAALLSNTGLVEPAPSTDKFIARIYKLDLADGHPPLFFVLLHGNENGLQSLTLYMQR